jgi:2-oxoglutarate dehydrogenase E1 component
MAHRCRLNTLVHVLNQPYESMLAEFFGTARPMQEVGGDGDVKYHLGFANSKTTTGGKTVKVSLIPNPSHLEMINPIHQGIVRCKQDVFGDPGREKVVPIAMHGDAAFTGQGVVAETLNLSELHGFRTGGTIHIIINNQIGFTTPPNQERFTPYPTDMAKAIQAPVFHVNGDDPEMCLWAAKLAVAFRQRFKCDVMIDLWCYRRNGHNETDEPSFTQPVMYKRISEHPSVRRLYEQKLLAEGRISQAELDQMKAAVIDRLSTARDQAKEDRPRAKVPSFAGVWKGLGPAGDDWSSVTKVSRDALDKVIDVYNHKPDGFVVHPKVLKGVVEKRQEMVATGRGIDWGTAEMLAWGTLLNEGFGIRLTGQDVERGTFSHRHAVLNDYETGKKWFPLDRLCSRRDQYMVINSMLSEFAVLGFEWGYASADPNRLCMWEAQFGDFVNGAQPIIDQIISSAESKWRYHNGIVLLLPHGYEGAGPEHSNAYVERFLHMSAEDNWQVCMLSTPAQYFHALRRQMHRKFRKPLILFQPKSILRDPQKASNIEELINGSFQTVIDDDSAPADRDAVRRVLLCSGKTYWMLKDACDQNPGAADDIALVRVEQYYPFPQKELAQVFAKYRRAEEICWVQEEVRNRGAWSFLQPRLLGMIPENAVLTYHGRDEAASPATGSMATHKKEEQDLIAAALELPNTAPEPTAPKMVEPAPVAK